MNGVRFSTDVESVDWSALRDALIKDDFDNGRTPEEYERSARGSFLNAYAFFGDEIVGNARVLSDGVCNAYVVDVWTRSDLRRQGIARQMMEMLASACQGQHIYLFTDDMESFYEAIGFAAQPTGMSKVVGSWLNR